MNGRQPVVAHQDRGAAEGRAVIWTRCGGRCEACGGLLRPGEWEAHHRQRRGKGTAGWCPCNLLALHPRCHNMDRASVHDNVAASRESGHLVSRYADPSQVPMDLPLGARVGLSNPVLLTCGGTYT